MENKDKFDYYIKKELEKRYSSPDYINKELILNSKSKEEFKIIKPILFIISLIQSLSIILIGVFFLSDVFLKLIVVGSGILLFNFSLSIYTLIINKEGVLI